MVRKGRSSQFRRVAILIGRDADVEYFPEWSDEEEVRILLVCGAVLVLSEPELGEIKLSACLPLFCSQSELRWQQEAERHLLTHKIALQKLGPVSVMACVHFSLAELTLEQVTCLSLAFKRFVQACWTTS